MLHNKSRASGYPLNSWQCGRAPSPCIMYIDTPSPPLPGSPLHSLAKYFKNRAVYQALFVPFSRAVTTARLYPAITTRLSPSAPGPDECGFRSCSFIQTISLLKLYKNPLEWLSFVEILGYIRGVLIVPIPLCSAFADILFVNLSSFHSILSFCNATWCLIKVERSKCCPVSTSTGMVSASSAVV